APLPQGSARAGARRQSPRRRRPAPVRDHSGGAVCDRRRPRAPLGAPGRVDAFDRASGLPSSWAVDVAPAPDGGVWAATLRDGAVRLDGNGTLRERRYPGFWGLRLYDDEGRILFGTQQGLAG